MLSVFVEPYAVLEPNAVEPNANVHPCLCVYCVGVYALISLH